MGRRTTERKEAKEQTNMPRGPLADRLRCRQKKRGETIDPRKCHGVETLPIGNSPTISDISI